MKEGKKVKRTEVMSLYKVWATMIQRCTNSRDKKYQQYGGRGITVCDRWRDFDLFYADLGDKPFEGAQIDRIDNDKGYEPGNVRWVSRKGNQRNRRVNHKLTFGGKTKCLEEWAEETGVKANTILTRIRRGWPVGESLGLVAHEPKDKLSDQERERRARNCQECGAKFVPRIGQIKKGQGKFCTTKCSLAYGLRLRWERERTRMPA